MLSRALDDDTELRPLEPWQAAEFAAHVDKVRAMITPWIPWANTIIDEAAAHAFLQSYADRQAADTGRLFGLYLSGVLQGGILYRTFDAAQGVCEIGVWLAPEARGRGLVARAGRVLIDWALEARGMTRVEWRCDPRNEASIAAARRLGFAYEGTLRKSFYFDGEHRDVEVWAIVT